MRVIPTSNTNLYYIKIWSKILIGIIFCFYCLKKTGYFYIPTMKLLSLLH